MREFLRWLKSIREGNSKRPHHSSPPAARSSKARQSEGRLRGEQLEDRIVPQGTSSQDFVSQVYTDLLHRTADSGGLAYWSGEIDAGVSPDSVVMSIESSAEDRDDMVEQMYESYLDRPADAAGLSFWAGELGSESVEQVQAGILGSSEFYADAGGTVGGFLEALYEDVLHRSVDSSGAANFSAELSSGVSRTTVAYEVITSTEGRVDLITSYYERFLHRAPDASGLENWVAQLDSGASDQSVIAGIVSSVEYQTRSPNQPDVTNPSAAITVTSSTETIDGTAENGSLVQIYSDGTVVGSEQLQGAQTNFSITVSLTSDSVNNFTATATNSFGNSSAATTVPAITQSSSTATVSITAPAEQENHEGDTVDLTVSATDSAGNTLTYSATNLPSGLTIDSSTGVISGTVATGDADESPYTVTLTATDTTGATDSTTFTWLVDNSTDPTVTAPADQTNTEGDEVSGVTVTATEDNENPLTYSATGLPAGLTINSSTGVISGTITPGDDSVNPYTVTVSATDGLNTGSATFTWTVNAVVAVTAPSSQTNTEGDTVSNVAVTATDSKGNTLTYSAQDLPDGLSINTSTGIISGAIDAGDAASSPYTVTVTATDGTYSSSASFTWTINPVVTITAPSDQTNTQGDVVNDVTVTASDSLGDSLTYEASGLPAGLSIDTTTGIISGTIGNTDATSSPYTVTVTASDGTYSSSTSFTWTINPVVAVTNPGSQTNDDGDTVTGLTITATDSKGNTLSYLATGLPTGLSIDPTTGVISGTIGSSDTAEAYTVTVTASDGTYSGSTTFTWTIASAPTAPTIASPNEAIVVSTSTYTITGTATSDSLVQVYSNGAIVGSEQLTDAATDFSITVPLTSGAVNEFDVTESDAAGNESTSTEVSITQSSATVSVATLLEQMNHEDDSVDLPISATDSSGGTLSYTATGLPAGLTIDSGTGVISGTVSTGDATSSPYTVTVTATDGTNAGSATFTWLIDDSTNPTVTAPVDQTNSEGDTVSGITVTATETNDNPLTYSATGLPAGLTINSTTGVISGTIATGDASASPYTVTVSASDGLNTGSASFTWNINPVVLIASPGDQTSTEGNVVSGVTVEASDTDSGTLSYFATGLPAGLVINTATGVISGTIDNNVAANSPYTVTIAAIDGDSSASTSFTWTVQSPVVLTAPADQTNTEGVTVSDVTVTATDSTSGTLTYSANGLPAGLSINPTTGVISGTIGADAAGSPYTVTVAASDGTYSSSATFTWTVNPAVVVTAPADQSNNEADVVSSVAVTATDASGGTITYSAKGLPAGLSINTSTGVISGTIATGASNSSPYTVTVTATDGTYSASTTFTWTIGAAGTPVVTAPATQQNAEGDTVSGLQVTATQNGTATLTYSATGLPAGLTINSSTGVISGTVETGDSDDSPYTVTVSVSNGINTGTTTFTWVVLTTSTNTLPFSLTDSAWQTLPSGVRIWDVTTGTGATAEAGDTITVTYTGYLADGTVFNATTTGFSTTLNTTDLIAGWVDGIPGMQVGGERRIDIPASLAYGSNPPSGSSIPDNAELVFDITLTSSS